MAVDAPVGLFTPQFVSWRECVGLPLVESSNRTEEQTMISLLIQQHHIEIRKIFVEKMNKLNVEVEEQRIRHNSKLVAVCNQLVAKRIQEKDIEIRNMVEKNWLLQTKLKSIYDENQSLRDSSQMNAAVINSLQRKYDQILAEYSRIQLSAAAAAVALDEDAGSCCNGNEGAEIVDSGGENGYVSEERYRCRKCGERESSVLLLPCRHLCLCSLCGSTLLTCPVCNSPANGKIRVNNY